MSSTSSVDLDRENSNDHMSLSGISDRPLFSPDGAGRDLSDSLRGSLRGSLMAGSMRGLQGSLQGSLPPPPPSDEAVGGGGGGGEAGDEGGCLAGPNIVSTDSLNPKDGVCRYVSKSDIDLSVCLSV